MTANRIYIAGPMTGIVLFNHAAFNAAALKLRAEFPAATVYSPAEVTLPEDDQSWANYMRAGITDLVKCDTIYVLKGWENSDGATLELTIARSLGMQVIYEGA